MNCLSLKGKGETHCCCLINMGNGLNLIIYFVIAKKVHDINSKVDVKSLNIVEENKDLL